MWDEDWDLEESEAEYEESREGIVLDFNVDYRTLDGDRASIGYIVKGKEVIYVGHVAVAGTIVPSSWAENGKSTIDSGFDLIAPWVAPTKYIRYVYIHRNKQGMVTTTVTEESVYVPDLITSKRVVLSGNS